MKCPNCRKELDNGDSALKHLRECNVELKDKKCVTCGKSMKNGFDETIGKISKNIWEYDCKCMPKNFKLMTL